MGVYSVRGLEPGAVSSLRTLLDKELGETNRKLLSRKSRESSTRTHLSSRRDVDMGEMIDGNELYDFLIADYFLEMSRKDFLKRISQMDRDGTLRLRARDIRAMLTELVIDKAEVLRKEESDLMAAGHTSKPATPAGSTRSLQQTPTRAVVSHRFLRSAGKMNTISAKNLKMLTETSLPREAASILKGPGSKKTYNRSASGVNVLYTVQTLGVLEEIQKRQHPETDETSVIGSRSALESDQRSARQLPAEVRAAEDSPLSIVLPDDGSDSPRPNSPFQARILTQRGDYGAKLRAAVYDYGPRINSTSHSAASTPLPDRTLRLPPAVTGSGDPNGVGNMFVQDEAWADAVRAELGIVTTQTYLTAPNHSSRPATSQALRPQHNTSRPSTCPNDSRLLLGPNSKNVEEESPAAFEERQIDSTFGRPSTTPVRRQTFVDKVTPGSIRPMSRYKMRQGETLLLKEYQPSRAEMRLGWSPKISQSLPASPTKKPQKLPLGRAMMSDIKVKERPVSNSLKIKLQAFHQVRQSEARLHQDRARKCPEQDPFAVEAW